MGRPNKGISVKGIPVKGTPLKGIPVKGIPIKGIPVKGINLWVLGGCQVFTRWLLGEYFVGARR